MGNVMAKVKAPIPIKKRFNIQINQLDHDNKFQKQLYV